jgi:tRNA/tmRNA/rRNA uracil-C5-methylase (TrmA/RlmC/RlmD family)
VSRRPPLPRHPIAATVDGFTHGGEGVVRVEGKAVFVPGALPGETVRVEVVDDRKRWARARLLEVLEASPWRVAADDAQRHACGGCDLQHVDPAGQLALKTRVVREQLERVGRLTDPPVEDARAVGPATGYRTTTRLHADAQGRFGTYLPGSHEVVPLERCPALSPAVVAHLGSLAGTGAAEATVRAHAATGTAAIVLRPGPGPLELPAGEADVLLEQPDGSLVAMRGDGQLAEEVAGRTYRFDAGTFFQVNTAGAEALVAAVLDAGTDGGDLDGALVWDLYAGVGLFSLPLAAGGAEVVAVEGHAAATAWLERNARDADLPAPIEVRTGAVERFTRGVRRGDDAVDPPDLVVLDPPRVGAGTDVVDDLAALAVPVVVYVACDPAALARDAAALAAAGYHLRHARPLDLFPLTHHVETVATFVR